MEVYMFEGPINCTVPMPDGFQAGRPLFLSSVLVQVFRFEGTLFSCTLYMNSMRVDPSSLAVAYGCVPQSSTSAIQ